jgi:hypothetical protein
MIPRLADLALTVAVTARLLWLWKPSTVTVTQKTYPALKRLRAIQVTGYSAIEDPAQSRRSPVTIQ